MLIIGIIIGMLICAYHKDIIMAILDIYDKYKNRDI
jgi:hypothetical protein